MLNRLVKLPRHQCTCLRVRLLVAAGTVVWGRWAVLEAEAGELTVAPASDHQQYHPAWTPF